MFSIVTTIFNHGKSSINSLKPSARPMALKIYVYWKGMHDSVFVFAHYCAQLALNLYHLGSRIVFLGHVFSMMYFPCGAQSIFRIGRRNLN